MKRIIYPSSVGVCFLFLLVSFSVIKGQIWSDDGNAYFNVENNEIIKYTLPENSASKIIANEMLIPKGEHSPIRIEQFVFSSDQKKILIFTNSQRVWRINTRGDYWILDLKENSLKQLGKSLGKSSLMFAKFSPDGTHVAYVSNNNIYVEDAGTNHIRALTADGNRQLINGTFDWAYEEEFFCRDGFRWSPDSKLIAFWQIDASKTGAFYMINNTDSLRPFIIPVEYPLVGERPSSCKVGVVNLSDNQVTWMKIPGEPDQNYIIRMEFIPWSKKLLIHQINRKQNESRLFVADPVSGNSDNIYEEKDQAWVDVLDYTGRSNYEFGFTLRYEWLISRRSFVWISEKDGWRHLYEISPESKAERKITEGNFDIIEFNGIDEKNGHLYFMASPENATQQYLYRARITGRGETEIISPEALKGTHTYSIAPGCQYARHSFSNSFTRPSQELITLNDGNSLNNKKGIAAKVDSLRINSNVEFFQVTTSDGITMDGWMVKPVDFDTSKKYPVVFYVYTEPWETTVKDRFGIGRNFLYAGNMARDGYIYISLDNRGTPALKGREWRKSIYRQIGRLNIRDQAMAAAEIIKWPFVDAERVGVWGWSGGGSATLNLMFQYPEIYKTGIAIAAISNYLTYDNIYTERYMGLPQENMDDFVKGSPVTYARNLKGNLLIIHGTGDDNVHYRNTEMLVNELVKYNKMFQVMAYPNRSHSMAEGEGTVTHLRALYTDFLKKNCPPGGR